MITRRYTVDVPAAAVDLFLVLFEELTGEHGACEGVLAAYNADNRQILFSIDDGPQAEDRLDLALTFASFYVRGWQAGKRYREGR